MKIDFFLGKVGIFNSLFTFYLKVDLIITIEFNGFDCEYRIGNVDKRSILYFKDGISDKVHLNNLLV